MRLSQFTWERPIRERSCTNFSVCVGEEFVDRPLKRTTKIVGDEENEMENEKSRRPPTMTFLNCNRKIENEWERAINKIEMKTGSFFITSPQICPTKTFFIHQFLWDPSLSAARHVCLRRTGQTRNAARELWNIHTNWTA